MSKCLKLSSFRSRSLANQCADDSAKSREGGFIQIDVQSEEKIEWNHCLRHFMYFKGFDKFGISIKKKIKMDGVKSLSENQRSGMLKVYRERKAMKDLKTDILTDRDLDRMVKILR